MNFLQNERKIATQAVVKACIIAREIQNKIQNADVFSKEDASPVTLADYCCQVIINQMLHEHFPQDELMGEETSKHLVERGSSFVEKICTTLKAFNPREIVEFLDLGQSDGGRKKRFWAIDPIDGTKGFLRKNQYAVAVSLIEDGKPILGVLGCPMLSFKDDLGALFIAAKGQKCFGYNLQFSDETLLNVADENAPENIIYCESKCSQTHSYSKSAQIARLLNAHPHPFQMDSQCKYGLIAQAKASVYLRLPEKQSYFYTEKVWDHAAGTIIVEEAGGKVTDALGKELDFGTGQCLTKNLGIIATNRILHSQVIAASRQLYSQTN